MSFLNWSSYKIHYVLGLNFYVIVQKIYNYRVSHIEMVETKWLWMVAELRILMNYGA